MAGVHSLLSPSSSKRWLNCPPSARLNQRLTERFGQDTSEYAQEGTKAHALCELKLRLYLKEINQFSYDEQRKALGTIPAEMERASDYYADICIEYHLAALNKCPDAKMYVEHRLNMDEWAEGCFGTGDCIIVSDAWLDVIDFKYGTGVPVSAVNNPQARFYGLGALHEFGELYGFNDIRNTIIQPRLDSVTEEILTRDELLAWGEYAKPLAKLAFAGQGEFNPGEWCRFCNAKAICMKRVYQALHMVETGFASPDVIDDSTIAGIYKILPLVKEWTKNFEDYVLAQAMRGQKIEGFKLVHGRRPARAFRNTDEAELVLTRAGYTSDQYMTEPKLKSVSDLEKMLGKSAFKALLGEQVVQGEGALTLVPEDDRRDEYSSADADFADLV